MNKSFVGTLGIDYRMGFDSDALFSGTSIDTVFSMKAPHAQ